MNKMAFDWASVSPWLDKKEIQCQKKIKSEPESL